MKNLLIVALSAGALYLLYTAYKKNQEQEVASPPDLSDKAKEPAFVCPEGEILCETKEKTCYNASAKYIVHPCS